MQKFTKYTVLFVGLILLICLLNIYRPFITTQPIDPVASLETTLAAQKAKRAARDNIRQIEEEAEIAVNKELGGIDEVAGDNLATGVTNRKRYMLAKEGFQSLDTYELRLFWSPDCGHSKRFMPVWLNILRALPDSVTYKEYNCKATEGLSSLSVCSNRDFGGITALPAVQLYRVVDGIKYNETITGYRDYKTIKEWLAKQSVNLKYNPNSEHFKNMDTLKGISDDMKIEGSAGDLYEDAYKLYQAESSTDDWGHYRDVEDGCYKASFTRCDEQSETPGYQVFTPRGQWGCVFPKPGSAIATDFDAAFAVVDNYLTTCTPPKQNKDGTLATVQYTNAERQKNMTKCAMKYKNEIRDFGLCDETKLNEKFNYMNAVKAGRAKLPIKDMDVSSYIQTAESAAAIYNACTQ